VLASLDAMFGFKKKGSISMSIEENKATVRRFFEEALNQGNLALAEELNALNWVYHDPDAPDVRTIADYTQWFSQIRSAYPDFHVTIEDLVAEGDQVEVHYSWRGTNTGDFVTPAMQIPLPANR
jgi:predicted SnoaL-like aldol condensation-catalyzing enzyme